MRRDRKFSAKSWDKFLNEVTTKINLNICNLYIITGRRYMALITGDRIFIGSALLEVADPNHSYKVKLLREYPAEGKYLCGFRLLRNPIPCFVKTKINVEGKKQFQLYEPPGTCCVRAPGRKRHTKSLSKRQLARRSPIQQRKASEG